MFLPPIPNELHSAMSRSKKKLDIYYQDFYYEMSFTQAYDTLQESLLFHMNNVALLVIKPDAVFMNRIPLIVQWLFSNGYEILYMSELYVTHTQTTELWKYQWSAASIDRIIVNEKLMEMGHSFLLLLRNKEYTATNNDPLSVRLTEQKGAAKETLRLEYHLRSILKPLNIILNYVHTADEPADVIREIGILCGTYELSNVYASILSGHIKPYSMILEKIRNKIIPEVGKPEELLLSLWNSTRKELYDPDRAVIEKHLYDVVRNKRFLNLQLLISAHVIKKWTWDWLVASSFLIQYDSNNLAIL